MNSLQKYKNLLREKISTLLYQKALKNERSAMLFKKVKRVGILFDLVKESEEIHKKIMRFAENLTDKEQIVAIAYVPKTNESDRFYNFYHFSEEDLNWFYQPKSKRLKTFVEEPFDLLINFSDSLNYPMRFVTAYSKARFKIGRHISGDMNPYDFSIKMKAEDATESFIKEVEYYIKNVFSS